MNAPGLTIRRDATPDGGTRVSLAGELDIAGVDHARGELEAAWLEPGPLLIDLDELIFMDSTGLRMLIEVVAQARLEERDLQITRGSPPIRRLFEIAGVEAVLPLQPDA
jgi:anti-anti-sigma factor